MSINALDDAVDGEDAMARATKAKRLPNAELVSLYLAKFKLAGTDSAAFDVAMSELDEDTSVTALEFIAIANAYAIAGVKVTSKAAALKRLKKRFTEIVRAKGNMRIAEKTRPW